jgi:hypothetical protein
VRPALGALLHGVAACCVALTALTGGSLLAFVAAPVSLLLAAQALAVGRGISPEAPRRSVGLGLLGLASGALFLAAARPGAALFVAGFGVAVVLWGTRAALAFDPPPRGCALPKGFHPLLHLGVAADETIRLGFELKGLCVRGPEYTRVAAEARIAADRNREQGWIARPERAHPIPPPLEKPQLAACWLRGVGAAERLSFASEFQPQDPEIRNEYLAALRNRTAHATLLRRPHAPRPTLIVVEGAGMARVARGAGLQWLHRTLGLDLALFVLPLQGPPSPRRGSGLGWLGGHPLWTNAVLGQGVWDLRRLVGYLRSQGAPAVGVFGVGLGGYAAAVFASVEEGLACAVAMTVPASLEALFWRQLPPPRRAEARAAGLTPHVLENAWARHAPLRLRPRVPHAARLVVGGLADRIVPPDQVGALWEHWGQPAVHWYPGTHLAWRGAAAMRGSIGAHLRECLASTA